MRVRPGRYAIGSDAVTTAVMRGVATTMLLAAAACSSTDEADAYGNFEAIEVVVSSQTAGTLLEFTPHEGDRLAAGTTAGLVDTVQLALERSQLLAQVDAGRARMVEASRQLDVVEAQLTVALRGYERIQRLADANAATAQQLDQAEREYRTLDAQARAVTAQRTSVQREVQAAEARVDQVADRMTRARVINPVDGTVLATYVQVGELVQVGTPLYRIANLDTLELRAYLSGNQLTRVALGGDVTVRVDDGAGSLRSLPGVISWIAGRAEFTPTPVQTREERVDLVYAVKVRVANPDGLLRIGMPGEVMFDADSGADTNAVARR